MEIILLVFTLTLDAFVASFAYGTNRIEIPFTSILIIDLICAIFLAISIFLGEFVGNLLPQGIVSFLSFLILFFLGLYYIFESFLKTTLKKRIHTKERLRVKLYNIWLIVDIYVDEIRADFDRSKKLNPREALYLATALSLDSLTIGFSSGLSSVNLTLLLSTFLIFHVFAIGGGLFIGKKLIDKTRLNISWISGLILILLAFVKL